MSVAELKTQAAALSFEEVNELARHVRALALRKNPVRQKALRAALAAPKWLSEGELEKALADLEKRQQ